VNEDILSEDGMWRWDGTQWQPTQKNQAARVQAETPPVAVHEATNVEGTDVIGVASDTSSTLVAAEQQPPPSERTPSRAEIRAQIRAEKKASRADRKADAKARNEMLTLARSPAGKARTAFERGDHLFQCSFDVMSQQAVVVVMVGSTTTKKSTDPTETLNAVAREGWELVTGSFVFIEEGQQSRDKFMSSGQNVATKGRTMGYYLFKRNEAMRVRPTSAADDVLDEALDEVTDEEQQAPEDA